MQSQPIAAGDQLAAPANAGIFTVGEGKMSSFDLLELINRERIEAGETAVRRNDFTARCRDELAGEHYDSFVVSNGNGTTSEALALTRDQCMFVSMRESKGVRRRVTAKLNELQQPREMTRLELLDMARDSEVRRLAAEATVMQQAQALALAAPKVDFHDRYAASTGNKGVREVAKLLGANERHFIAWLLRDDGGCMYRLAGSLTPKAQHMGTGRFTVKAGTADHGGDNTHAFNQAKFTPKGVTWIAGEWGKHQMDIAQAAKR